MVFCVPQVPTFVLFPWIFTLVLSFCCAIKISIFFFFLVFSFFLFFVFFLIFLIFFHFYSFKWWEKFMVFCVSQVPTFVLFPWIFTLVLSFCCATKISIFFFFLVSSFFFVFRIFFNFSYFFFSFFLALNGEKNSWFFTFNRYRLCFISLNFYFCFIFSLRYKNFNLFLLSSF